MENDFSIDNVTVPLEEDPTIEMPPSPLDSTRLTTFRLRRCRLYLQISLAVCTIIGTVILGFAVHTYLFRDVDSQLCEMTYTYTNFFPLGGFDTSHSRLAKKYGLWLYREGAGYSNLEINGIPVLFVPGNAGSYRQGRSLASKAAQGYWHTYRNSDLKDRILHFDFFSVDFNEELSAFHSTLLLEQAEYVNDAIMYILSLYADPKSPDKRQSSSLPAPTSVILIGHSMGGLVTRAIFALPNYVEGSVNSLITWSSPHTFSPVPLYWGVTSLYEYVNEMWKGVWDNRLPKGEKSTEKLDRCEFLTERNAGKNMSELDSRLMSLSVISIAGGTLDSTVPSSLCDISSLVPPTHGFTVFASSISNSWTSADHNSILWCQQFLSKIAQAMFESVDINRPEQTLRMAERLRVWKRVLIGGDTYGYTMRKENCSQPLEDGGNKPIVSETFNLTQFQYTLVENQTIGVANSSTNTSLLVMLLPTERMADFKLEVMTSLYNLYDFNMYQCYDAEPPSATVLSCVKFDSDIFTAIPSSLPPNDKIDYQREFHFAQFALPLKFNSSDIIASHVLIQPRFTLHSSQFIWSKLSRITDAVFVRSDSMASMVHNGLEFELPLKAIKPQIFIEGMKDSLSVWSVGARFTRRCKYPNGTVTEQDLSVSDDVPYYPILLQSLPYLNEHKFTVHPSSKSNILMSIHGLGYPNPNAINTDRIVLPSEYRSPYDLFQSNQEDSFSPKTVSLHMFSPFDQSSYSQTEATCEIVGRFSLRIDWRRTPGQILTRYPMSLVAFPVAVIWAVWGKQIRVYNDTGVFPTFIASLASILPYLPIHFLLLFLICVIQSTIPSSRNHLPPFLHPPSEFYLSFLLPTFWLIGISLSLIYYIISYFIFSASKLIVRSFRSLPLIRNISPSLYQKRNFKKRFIVMVILWVSTLLFLPYSFGILVVLLLQLSNTVALARRLGYFQSQGNPYPNLSLTVRDRQISSQNSNLNFNLSFFYILFIQLPFWAPSLLVWIRNLDISYYPFPESKIGLYIPSIPTSSPFEVSPGQGEIKFIKFSTDLTIYPLLPLSSAVLLFGQNCIPRIDTNINKFGSYFSVLICWVNCLICLGWGVKYTWVVFWTVQFWCGWYAVVKIWCTVTKTSFGVSSESVDQYEMVADDEVDNEGEGKAKVY
ncbi:PGAP1-like protein-domain-containing protein [Paraphysoderma sedebokerense]|nr:PGAP1-like protein-domain-containing protein [Paraphysoderma sedebokerense]